jgi:hypothetical protein
MLTMSLLISNFFIAASWVVRPLQRSERLGLVGAGGAQV